MCTSKSHWNYLIAEMTCVVQLVSSLLWALNTPYSSYSHSKSTAAARWEIVDEFLPEKQFTLKILYSATLLPPPSLICPRIQSKFTANILKRNLLISLKCTKGGKILLRTNFSHRVKRYAQKTSDNTQLALLVSHPPESCPFIMP